MSYPGWMAPDMDAVRKNADFEPEGERIRAELHDFLERNKICGMLLDTPHHHVNIQFGPNLPNKVKSVLSKYGGIYVVESSDVKWEPAIAEIKWTTLDGKEIYETRPLEYKIMDGSRQLTDKEKKFLDNFYDKAYTNKARVSLNDALEQHRRDPTVNNAMPPESPFEPKNDYDAALAAVNEKIDRTLSQVDTALDEAKRTQESNNELRAAAQAALDWMERVANNTTTMVPTYSANCSGPIIAYSNYTKVHERLFDALNPKKKASQ